MITSCLSEDTSGLIIRDDREEEEEEEEGEKEGEEEGKVDDDEFLMVFKTVSSV